MKALILAAGYATRLYPLTREYPKPLLEVNGRPIIDYIIDKLDKIEDIREIIVITNNKFIPQFKKWQIKLSCQKKISLVDDLTKDHIDRRGAIGDMDFAIKKKRIRDDLLAIGGDNLFDGGLADFISFAKINQPQPTIGVYNIRQKKQAKNYGVVRLGKDNKVLDFQEKPVSPKSTLIAMCLYYFPKGKLRLSKKYLDRKTDKTDATGFYIDWLRKQERVYGFIFTGRWYDIGHPEIYKEAKENYGRA